MNRSIRAIAVSLCAGFVVSCGASAPIPGDPTPPLAPGQVLTANATIRFIDIEGGCWAIETATGQRYEPVNLGPTYHTNGLAVRVVLRDAPDMAGICQMAPFVTIDSISTP